MGVALGMRYSGGTVAKMSGSAHRTVLTNLVANPTFCATGSGSIVAMCEKRRLLFAGLSAELLQKRYSSSCNLPTRQANPLGHQPRQPRHSTPPRLYRRSRQRWCPPPVWDTGSLAAYRLEFREPTCHKFTNFPTAILLQEEGRRELAPCRNMAGCRVRALCI